MTISTRVCGLGLVVAGWCAAPDVAVAQRRDSLPVAVGARVRVILHERPTVRIIGALVADDWDRVLVNQEETGILVGVEWKDIESIEVFRRRLTHHQAFGRGARVGAVVFGTIAVVGVVAAVVSDARGGCNRDEGDEYCVPATIIAIPLGYLATVGGTVVGGAVGLLFQDNWHTVWRPR
jgi:hypothetical protein